jgi:outer membrane lipoprotein-sorting protein
LKILKGLFILLLLLPQALRAQEKGFSALENTLGLKKELAANAEKVQTIASDFIQEKNMKMLQNKVISRGKFYFKQAGKIRIEYTSPFEYILVMNGGNITIKDDGKVNKINTRNSSTMQSVNQVMLDWMSGTVFENKDFSVRAYISADQYLMVLTPLDAAMKKMFSGIKIYMEKDRLTVSRLVMVQSNGDNTTMKFNHTKINSSLPDALFFIH